MANLQSAARSGIYPTKSDPEPSLNPPTISRLTRACIAPSMPVATDLRWLPFRTFALPCCGAWVSHAQVAIIGPK